VTALVVLAALGIGGGLVAWAARRRGGSDAAIGIVGLLVFAVLTFLAPTTAVPSAEAIADGTLPTSTLGGEAVAVTAYAHAFLLTLTVVGLLSTLLWAVTHEPGDPSPAAAFLASAGAAALALGIASPVPALVPAAVAGLAGLLAVRRPGSAVPVGGVAGAAGAGAVVSRGVDATVADPAAGHRFGLDVFRVGAGLALVITATELLIGRADVVAGEPFGVGAATLALAGGAALRLGSVPFHVHLARLAEVRAAAALPVLVLWGPALFAIVALAAFQGAVLPLELPLSVERGAIAAVGLLTIVAGLLGALLHDDLDHVLAYWVLHLSGFALFAFVADASAWGPARTWLLVVPAAATALLGWAAATASTFRTRSLLELRGWARRAPLLAIGVVIATLATFGPPGLAAWDARFSLVRGAFDGPLQMVVDALALVGLAILGRIVAIGVERPTSLVADAPDERLRRPAPNLRRRVGATAREYVELDRAPIAAVVVLALAALAMVVGSGAFGLAALAASDVPTALQGPEPVPGPTFQPIATFPPSPSPSTSASPTPTPTTRPTATPRPTRSPTATPRPTKS
jgi:formate hydrogenlyase subunit 3/multisubunit Na+/H+ antiporter MnhD subunit